MKKLTVVLLPLLFLSSAHFSFVSAHNGIDHTVHPENNLSATSDTSDMRTNLKMDVEAKKESVMAGRVDLAHANADKEIDRRIAALNIVITKINGMKRISSDQKTALLVQVQSAIADLTNLKVKIAADTDPATLKTDKQSIVTSYRVFLFLIPKVDILAHADLVLQLSSQMTTNDSVIQTKIQTAQDSGKDVVTINALFSDRKTKIADAQTQANDAISSVTALTPDGYPANKSTLVSSKEKLKTARKDLNDAYQDLVKINTSLSAMQ